jgi:hypothetical protein
MIDNEQDYWNMRFNEEQRQMNIYYEYLGVAAQSPFLIYKPKIFKDGDLWCALLGDSLQEGVVGFGVCPEDAKLDFDYNWFGNHYHECGRNNTHRMFHRHSNNEISHVHVCEKCQDEGLEISLIKEEPAWRRQSSVLRGERNNEQKPLRFVGDCQEAQKSKYYLSP